MKIGNRIFEIGKETYIMGILNITPDSFSDGGKYWTKDQALRHAEKMIKEGADIIDIGGESTRPGHVVISEQEEMERVLPVLELVRSNFEIPVSLDTYKSAVAQAGIQAGADLINDIWGLRQEPDMARIIAKAQIPCCIMHNRAEAAYGNFMREIIADFSQSIQIAEEAGIREENIILDPGIGFGKSLQDNLKIMNKLEELHMFGYPLLLGTSRKSMIGLTLDLPVEERLEGTLATTVIGVMKGVSFIRVHDVLENARAVKMTKSIINAE